MNVKRAEAGESNAGETNLCLPRLYAIADRTTLERKGISVREFAQGMREAGIQLLQYRDKQGSPQQVLEAAAEIASILAGTGARLILNDRADLAVIADWDGVHTGHLDLPPAAARNVVGKERIVGVSTHNDEQVRAAEASVADYIAIGPVFATGSKPDTEPVVGLDGVRRARALTSRPLVAIGGITRANARAVIEAGADSVAVIGGLFGESGESLAGVAQDFLRILL